MLKKQSLREWTSHFIFHRAGIQIQVYLYPGSVLLTILFFGSSHLYSSKLPTLFSLLGLGANGSLSLELSDPFLHFISTPFPHVILLSPNSGLLIIYFPISHSEISVLPVSPLSLTSPLCLGQVEKKQNLSQILKCKWFIKEVPPGDTSWRKQQRKGKDFCSWCSPRPTPCRGNFSLILQEALGYMLCLTGTPAGGKRASFHDIWVFCRC